MSYKFKYGKNVLEVPKKSDITWTNVLNKPSAFTPSTHSHDWNSITSKPTTFNPVNHNHGYDTWCGYTRFPNSEWIGFYNNYKGSRKTWMGHDGGMDFQIVNETGNAIALRIGKKNTQVYFAHTDYPYFTCNVDNQAYLGVSWFRWKQLFAGTGTISTSDETKKKNIDLLNEKYYQLAEKIDIVSFQFKETDQEDSVGRTHIGAISQRVEKALEEVGLTAKDFAGFCKDQKYKVTHDEKGKEVKEAVKGEYDYSLRYDELAMLKIWYLEEKSEIQKEKIDLLRDELEIIKKMLDILCFNKT